MKRWTNTGLMLAQRLRRWPNIKPILDQCFVFVGLLSLFKLNDVGRLGLAGCVRCQHTLWLQLLPWFLILQCIVYNNNLGHLTAKQ